MQLYDEVYSLVYDHLQFDTACWTHPACYGCSHGHSQSIPSNPSAGDGMVYTRASPSNTARFQVLLVTKAVFISRLSIMIFISMWFVSKQPKFITFFFNSSAMLLLKFSGKWSFNKRQNLDPHSGLACFSSGSPALD